MAKGGPANNSIVSDITPMNSRHSSNLLGAFVLAEASLPFGANQWSNVSHDYNRDLPQGWPPRDGEQIKRKLQALKNVRKPTGSSLSSNYIHNFSHCINMHVTIRRSVNTSRG